ncbi:MAG: ribonuclease [Blautia sp.]|nr:ribonuclease [Blautia sp.]
MKKRLCLFMMSLLLLVSTGCSQTAPQAPETPETFSAESLETASDAITTAAPTNESNLNINTAELNNAEESSLSNDSDDSETAPGDDSFDSTEDNPAELPEDSSYTTKEDVALYIHLYGHLPPNFITKKEAEALGWSGGSLEPYAPGKCIGGNRFGNYEGLLPQADGRSYTECDIDTLGADKRGAKRIVFSNDGLIYYTEDHYESFELLYGEAEP